jgi:hypothetical protein
MYRKDEKTASPKQHINPENMNPVTRRNINQSLEYPNYLNPHIKRNMYLCGLWSRR